jgi:hypothetical protein
MINHSKDFKNYVYKTDIMYNGGEYFFNLHFGDLTFTLTTNGLSLHWSAKTDTMDKNKVIDDFYKTFKSDIDGLRDLLVMEQL